MNNTKELTTQGIHEQIDKYLELATRIKLHFDRNSTIQLYNFPEAPYFGTTLNFRSKAADYHEKLSEISETLGLNFELKSPKTNKFGESVLRYVTRLEPYGGKFTVKFQLPCTNPEYEQVRTLTTKNIVYTHCVPKNMKEEFINNLPSNTRVLSETHIEHESF